MFSYRNGSLLDEFDRVQRELDQLMGNWPRSGIRSGRPGAFPPINIGVTTEDVHVYVFAPGLHSSDFDVSIQQNVLSVAGVRKPDTPENCTWHLRERFDGEFRRVVTLPEDVDPAQVDASYRDGVLHLCVKRQATVRPRQIAIN